MGLDVGTTAGDWSGHGAAGLRGFLDPGETRVLAALLPVLDPWLSADGHGAAAANPFRRVSDMAAARHHGLFCASNLRIDPDGWADHDPDRDWQVLHPR